MSRIESHNETFRKYESETKLNNESIVKDIRDLRVLSGAIKKRNVCREKEGYSGRLQYVYTLEALAILKCLKK